MSEWVRVETKLSPSDSKRVAEGYLSGIKAPELLEKYEISRASIYYHLAEHDVVLEKTPLTKEQVDRTIMLYRAGITLAAVANQIGSNIRAITLAMEERGVPRRPRGVRVGFDPSMLEPAPRPRPNRRFQPTVESSSSAVLPR